MVTLIAAGASYNSPWKQESLRILMNKKDGIDYGSLKLNVEPIFIAIAGRDSGDGWYKRLSEEYLTLLRKKPK